MPAILKQDAYARLSRAGRVEVDEQAEAKEGHDVAVAALNAQVEMLQRTVAELSRELGARIDSTNAERTATILRSALATSDRATEAMTALSKALSKEPPKPEPLPDPRGATWELRMPGVGYDAPDRVVTITRTA